MSGSRGQTPASASSGPSTDYASSTLNGRASSSTASPRRSEDTKATAANRGAARPSHRQGTSAGGFLLDSLSSHSRSSPTSRRYGSLKGKDRIGQERIITPQHHSAYETSQSVGASPAGNSTASTDGDQQSSRGTPEPRSRPISHNPYMTQSKRHDPTQLVNIALQLNQNRQRQASARFQPHTAGTGLSGRVVSTGSTAPSGVSAGHDSQRHGTYGETELATGAVIANGLGTQQQDSYGAEGYTDPDGPAALEFYPSPQTLIRAERARIALELKYHHRRVLQHLPRLPPPKGPRLDTATSENSDGSITPAFGRAYNPLQYARNRRIRMQKRCPLQPEKDGWDDLDRAKAWVEEVTAQRHIQISSIYDNYPLPYFRSEVPQLLEGSVGTLDNSRRPRANTRVPLPPNDWTVAAPDLFADLYWLQDGDNRLMIEDHNGDKLFPPAINGQATKLGSRRRSLFDLRKRSSSNPRASTESRRGSTNGRVPESTFQRDSSPEKKSARGTPNKSSKPRDRKGPRTPGSAKRKNRAPSFSSSDEDRNDRHRFPRPWSKAFGKHWEGTVMPDRRSLDQPRQSKESQRPGRISLDIRSPQSGQSRRPISIELHPPQEEQDPEEPKRDAFSDLDSTAPSSPIHAATVPSMALDFDSEKIFGSPPSRRGREKADRHHEVELRDFADPFRRDGNGARVMKIPSKAYTSTLSSPSETSLSGTDGKPRTRPQLKRNETERLPPRSPEETGFKVPKPWKAGKYVAGRVGDLLRRKDYASDTSETDEDSRRNGLKLQLSRATTASTSGPGTLSRSSTLSAVGESPSYRPVEMPSFSPVRREGQTGSPSRIKTSETISQRLAQDADANNLLSPASIGLKSPSRSLTPTLSRMATAEGKDSADSSRRPSALSTSNGRRGATFTDASGQQWPPPNRSNASAWPGESLDVSDKVTWTGPELKPTKRDAITESDIFRTEAMLRSLCIKAAAVTQTFQCAPSKPGPLLTEVRQRYSDQQLPVPKLHEHELLSGHLTKKVDSQTENLNQAAEKFITVSIRNLETQLDDTKSIVHDKLTGMVLAAGDDADGLGNKLSAGLTREVRDLNDSIDQILRARRRRNRFLRRILFGVLEWLITATMWAVWLVVVTFKLVRGVLRFAVAVIRWLFLL